MPSSHLPDDVAALKRIVASRDETIAQLLGEISRLKRWQYGRSSERITELMDQLQLALGDLPAPEAPDCTPAMSPDAEATAHDAHDGHCATASHAATVPGTSSP
jgi:transposase